MKYENENSLKKSQNIEKRDPIPLTFQDSFFIPIIEEGKSNIQVDLKFDGKANVDILVRSLNSVVCRHDALRSVYSKSGDIVEKSILENCCVEIEQCDLRSIEDTQNEVYKNKKYNCREFDFTASPRLRARLLWMPDSTSLLLMAFCHTIFDGQSAEILIRELAIYYTAIESGREVDLPLLSASYRDFSVLQNIFVLENRFNKSKRYWHDRFLGYSNLLVNKNISDRGLVCSSVIEVTECVTKQVEMYCRKNKVTLNIFITTLFNILYSHYFNLKDIVSINTITERNRLEFEGVIGLMSGGFYSRNEIDFGCSFKEILFNVKSNFLNDLSNLDVCCGPLMKEIEEKVGAPHLSINFLASSLRSIDFSQMEVTRLTEDVRIILDDANDREKNGGAIISGMILQSAPKIKGWVFFNEIYFKRSFISIMINDFNNLIRIAIEAPPLSLKDLLPQYFVMENDG